MTIKIAAIQKAIDSLAAVELTKKVKLDKDLDKAIATFRNIMEDGIDSKTVPADDEKVRGVYNKAYDLYEELDNAGDGEDLTPPETKTAEAKTPAKAENTEKGTASKGKATKSTDKAKTPAKPAAKTKDTGPKKPGIVATILDTLKAAKKSAPTTKDDILAVLVKAFPERDADKMAVSVSTIMTVKEIQRVKDWNLVIDKTEKPWKYWLGK